MDAGQTLALAGSTLQMTGTMAKGRQAAAEGERLAQEGIMARQVADYEAAGMVRQAREERAAGSVAAEEARRKGALVASKYRAMGAASGAPGGPGLQAGLLDIFTQGETQAQSETWLADQRAAGFVDKANVRTAEGIAAEQRGEAYRRQGKAARRSSILEGLAGHFGNMSKIKFG